MTANKRTLAALRRVITDQIARGTRVDKVVVAQRFITWLETRPQPHTNYEPYTFWKGYGILSFDELVSDVESDIRPDKLTLSSLDVFAKYDIGTWIFKSNFDNTSMGTIRQVGEREANEGWGVTDELGEKTAELWAIIHWISDSIRRDHITVPLISYATTAFYIEDPAMAFEFKMRFG